jgi:hypothetical protein
MLQRHGKFMRTPDSLRRLGPQRSLEATSTAQPQLSASEAKSIGDALGSVISTIGDVLTGNKGEAPPAPAPVDNSLIPGVSNTVLALGAAAVVVAVVLYSRR